MILRRILIVSASIFALLLPGLVVASANLPLTPATQTLSVGDSSSVTLSVNTGGDPINAAESALTFPQNLITITGISKAGLFSFWPVDPVYSNPAGTISFAGGLPSPGYTGTKGDIIVISFTADTQGLGQICETSARVLKNDGAGTNLFSGLSCADINIQGPEVPAAPTVTSPTHPDSNSAYANPSPEFTWILETGVTGFSFILDDASGTVPDDTSEGIGTQSSYTDLADGVWYFHIKAENANGWGAVTHFKVTIDSTLASVPGKPEVSSDTHPDENTWYPVSDATVSWTTESAITGISYHLDESPISIPDDVSEDATDTASTFIDLSDGVWYFHIKAENANGWGAVTHFTIRVDTNNPTVDAKFPGGIKTKDTTPDLFITAEDATSPIIRITVTINGVTKAYTLDQVQPLTLDQLPFGDHSIIVRAFDSAGNSAEVTLSITILPKTLLENIGDTITEAIPQPIRDFISNTTKPIRDVITDLQQNEAVRNFTQDIAEPISRAAAAIGVAVAVATLPAGLINALFAFARFAYLLLSPLFLRRRARSWGIVINGLTRRPVGGAVVRVFETEFNKLKESQITDALGRFGFLVDPGSYTLMAEKQGFIFPSKLIIKPVGKEEIYTGGVIKVDDKKNPHITATIPIDPVKQHMTPRALAWKRVRDVAVLFLDRINMPLLAIGLLVSFWVAVITPGTINTLILGLYALLVVLKIIRARISIQSFGTVLDAETKKPLGLAVVRIFNAVTRTMLTTRITNEQGKFSALVQTGSYYVMVTKPPYAPFHSDPVKLSKTETLAMDVELKKEISKFKDQKEPPKTPQPKEKSESKTSVGSAAPPTQADIMERGEEIKKKMVEKALKKQAKEIKDTAAKDEETEAPGGDNDDPT